MKIEFSTPSVTLGDHPDSLILSSWHPTDILGVFLGFPGFPYWGMGFPPLAHSHDTGHANFDFGWCLLLIQCCFYFWKMFEWSKLLLLRFPPPNKKISWGNFPISPIPSHPALFLRSNLEGKGCSMPTLHNVFTSTIFT